MVLAPAVSPGPTSRQGLADHQVPCRVALEHHTRDTEITSSAGRAGPVLPYQLFAGSPLACQGFSETAVGKQRDSLQTSSGTEERLVLFVT